MNTPIVNVTGVSWSYVDPNPIAFSIYASYPDQIDCTTYLLQRQYSEPYNSGEAYATVASSNCPLKPWVFNETESWGGEGFHCFRIVNQGNSPYGNPYAGTSTGSFACTEVSF